MLGERCYRFYVVNQLTWPDAKRECRDQGAELLKVDDQYEQFFISQYLRLLQVPTSDGLLTGIWIGANDRAKEGTFVWNADNTALTYTNWAQNQPNNEAEQDCVAMIAQNYFRWDDLNCDRPMRFVCEKPIMIETTLLY
ncbi:unnamed protein product [Gordionus sp. m RMFG-2023]|uniref:neurocan core protein-like n=1 Tax=Gordionus sp. m RMFG-2023 TaxID=3053472 RepID=UPI0030DE83F4